MTTPSIPWICLLPAENHPVEAAFFSELHLALKAAGGEFYVCRGSEPWLREILHGKGGFGRPAGVIGHVEELATAEALAAADIPTVLFAPAPVRAGRRSIVTGYDAAASGRLAAQHFLAQRRFASFIAFPLHGSASKGARDWADRLAEGFAAEVAKSGRRATVPRVSEAIADGTSASLDRLLLAAPRPIALLSPFDESSNFLVASALRIGLRVPEDVAVVGFGDTTLCECAPIPLSSASFPHAHLAARVVEWLCRTADGLEPPGGARPLAPDRIVARASSVPEATGADTIVARAMRYIAEHRDLALPVEDVARACCVSRRLLERHFRERSNRTVLGYIHEKRIGFVKELLETTDLPVGEIAARANFPSPAALSVLFHRVTGTVPARYRRRGG